MELDQNLAVASYGEDFCQQKITIVFGGAGNLFNVDGHLGNEVVQIGLEIFSTLRGHSKTAAFVTTIENNDFELTFILRKSRVFRPWTRMSLTCIFPTGSDTSTLSFMTRGSSGGI